MSNIKIRTKCDLTVKEGSHSKIPSFESLLSPLTVVKQRTDSNSSLHQFSKVIETSRSEGLFTYSLAHHFTHTEVCCCVCVTSKVKFCLLLRSLPKLVLIFRKILSSTVPSRTTASTTICTSSSFCFLSFFFIVQRFTPLYALQLGEAGG